MQFKRLAISLPILLIGLTAASGSSLVVPGSDATTNGDQNNGFPFNLGNFGIDSQRYQQVYGASAFGSSPILITGIDFRPDAGVGTAFSSTLSSIQIDLSTTSAAVDGLSLTFASNVGANDTVVVPDGPLSLSSSDTGNPPAFDIHIQFATPFLYDPTQGNLLLDVRNFSGGTTTQFDSDDTMGDATSRVFTSSSNGVNSATGGSADTQGLVTQFDFSASSVPEPSTGLLSAIGFAAALALFRLRR